MNLTERQKREQQYYDQYSHIGFADLNVTFQSIEGKEERPWDSYWFCYRVLRRLPVVTGRRKALDLGCGGGEHSIRLAKLGYEVVGLDISEENLKLARRKAAHYRVEAQTNFFLHVAEKLPFESGSFDLIFGIDILHHVEISPVMAECRRILKPGGLAIFREPVYVPLWDAVRNLGLVRRFASNAASFKKHITEDERKLDCKDFQIIQQAFPDCTMHRFRVLARLARIFPWPRCMGFLQRLDYQLIRIFPFFGRLGGFVVFELRK